MGPNRAERRATARANKKLKPFVFPNLLGFKNDEVKVKKEVEEIPVFTTVPTRVFRIEHPISGKGPFTHDERKGHRFPSDAMVLLKEPQDYKTLQLGYNSRHYYAFKDVKTMMRSIQSFVTLREFGFHFSEYESVESIIMPCGQVAFALDKATKIRSLPVHEFPLDEFDF